ncbi:MAG TPA: maltotransferase domain-containing protein, partial [Sedimentisphaerales bacterium]|nr:maltotransferase domain-containing protein [Sedimentisphaerales bacterium]
MAESTPQQLRATSATSKPTAGQGKGDDALRGAAKERIAIEGVSPEIDGGRFPAKRAVGDVMAVEADVFCDGHDKIDAALRYRCENEEGWNDVPMQFLGNDR